MSEQHVLLSANSLVKHFPVSRAFITGRPKAWVKAVEGVSFDLIQGQSFGLVGESGCGKTTIARMICLLERPTEGTILFQNQNAHQLRGAGAAEYRKTLQPVFQDPFSSLNPRMRVRDIVAEPLITTRAIPSAAIRDRVTECLERVGLRAGSGALYPHEFSGGQRQRIAMARAISCKPRLIVLDEPVSALDVSVRAQILNLLKDLQVKEDLTYFMIAHDLAAVKYMSSTVGVMYLGKLVEVGPSYGLYDRPLHPYTVALLSAALPSHPDAPRRRIVLSGEVPSPLDPPSGCRFHTRCPKVKDVCSKTEPQLKLVEEDHRVACHLC